MSKVLLPPGLPGAALMEGRRRGAGAWAMGVLALCALMLVVGAGPARAATLAFPFQSSFPIGSSAVSIAVNHETGNVLVLDPFGSSGAFISQYDASGTPAPFTDPALAGATELSNANAPSPGWNADAQASRIAVDNSGTASQGTIYLVTGNSPTVTAFAPSGAVLRTFEVELAQACGAGVAPDGNVWFGTREEHIEGLVSFADEYTSAGVPTGRRLRKPPSMTVNAEMCDVRVDGEGAIYARPYPLVAKYSPDLAFEGVAASDAMAIEVDATTGNLFTYARDGNGDGQIRQFTPDGDLAEETIAGAAGWNGAAIGLSADARLMYVLKGDGQIQVFGPSVRRPEMAAPSGIGTSVASLAGSVWPGGVATSYRFEYGTQKSLGSVAPAAPADAGSGMAAVAAGATLTGLKPLTYYFYRLVATVGGTDFAGPTKTLRTLGPVAAIGGFSAVGPTSVTLSGSADPRDLPGGTFRFRVAAVGSGFETTSAELAVPAGSGARPVSATVSGLPAGNTFTARLVASGGGVSDYSEEITFSTPELPKPGTPAVPEFAATPYGCGAPSLDALKGVRRPGELVTVSGHDLGTGGTLMLGGDRVATTGWSSTGVRFVVPRGASGVLAVSVSCGRRSNGVALTVAAASNAIRLGKATIKGSRATVSVKAPGAGRVSTSGRYVAGSTVTVRKAGTVKAKLRLTKAGQRALKRSHRLALSVRVRFVPDGGDGRTETKTITFTRGGVR
jgi:hypothetical protein